MSGETTTTSMTSAVRELYNAAALQAFNEKGQFWRSATIRDVAMGADGVGKGSKAVFDIWNTTAVNTTPLDEIDDGDATQLTLDQVAVELKEYGNYVKTTRKLRLTHYGETEEHAAWSMGQMASDTLDMLARGALDAEAGSAHNSFSGFATSVATIAEDNKLTAADVRTAFASLRSKNVPQLEGGYYLCFIHPHVLKDLKDETGDASWTKKELYSGGSIKPILDEVGTFEGFRFIMTTNCLVQPNAGQGGTVDVYSTYFLGSDALGFARAGEVPQIEISSPAMGPNDAYRRFQIISWYALCGFKALRSDALQKFHSSSSMASNG
jgi:N4-gp56 family major capsid protein